MWIECDVVDVDASSTQQQRTRSRCCKRLFCCCTRFPSVSGCWMLPFSSLFPSSAVPLERRTDTPSFHSSQREGCTPRSSPSLLYSTGPLSLVFIYIHPSPLVLLQMLTTTRDLPAYGSSMPIQATFFSLFSFFFI